MSLLRFSKKFTTVGILAAIMVLVALTASFAGTSDGQDEVVVLVNGEAVTQEQFYSALERAAGPNVLQQLVAQLLFKQAATEAGFEPSEEALEAELDKVKSQFPDEATFQEALTRYNFTIESFKEELKLAMVIDFLSTKDVKVTDEDALKYFEQNKANYSTPEQVNASHILVKTEDEAKDIISKLNEGSDFAELAKQFSQDPGSGPRGGNLGFFSRGEMVESFENAAFNLGVGEVSVPVQSQFGYHIIKVLERKDAEEADFESVKEVIQETLIQEQAKDPQALIQEILPSANLEFKWERYSDLF